MRASAKPAGQARLHGEPSRRRQVCPGAFPTVLFWHGVGRFLVQVTVMDITSPGISVTGENLLQRSDLFGRGGFVGHPHVTPTSAAKRHKMGFKPEKLCFFLTSGCSSGHSWG